MSELPPTVTGDAETADMVCWCLQGAWLAWRSGEPTPQWQDYLPPNGATEAADWIVQLLRADIEGRVKRGLPALLGERYFTHPRLQQLVARVDAQWQVELICWEYQQRWQSGERVPRADYLAAFPEHVAALKDLQPISACPRCGQAVVLEETVQTLHCPLCDRERPTSAPSSPPLGAAEARSPDPSMPILDRRGYELIERLGAGGMGEVYRASDPALGRDLAVKVMRPADCGHAEAEGRFLREARITGSLQHPGIVPIYNLGRLAGGRLHYTMRLVRGRTLADILCEDAGKPERLPVLLAVFEKVCQAVAYAHSKRVIHRDLKPSNVMVGKFGEVQVMDWGLAKLLTAENKPAVFDSATEREDTRIYTEAGDTPLELTRMGREMGTPAYMPPEQALGEWDTVDERTDVFALGAILCEILTGQPPYGCRLSEEALRKAKRGDVSEALTRLEGCGADDQLVALCRESLAPRCEDRPRDAEEVAQRVAAYQAQVQERLRRAELERAEALVTAREERKRRRWIRAASLVLVAGTALSSGLALWAIHTNKQLKVSEALAQARRKLAEKSNGVLAAIFKDLDPRDEEKDSPSLRVQLCRRMEKAAAQLEELSNLDDPAAVARLQSTLGRSLAEMGQLEQGIELLSNAGTSLAACLGPDDAETLDALSDLALAYEDADRMDKALPLYKQILARRTAKLGPNHPDTLSSQNSLGSAYRILGRLDDAVPLLEQTLARRKEQLGADDEQTLFTLNDLALAYESIGREEEALPLLEYSFTKVKDRYGFDQQHTLTVANNLAIAYKRAGRFDEALPLYKQVLDLRKGKLGSDHPKTLTSTNNLALAYWAAGAREKALPLLEQTLSKRKEKLPADHRDIVQSMHSLGSVYLAQGQLDMALPLLEDTVEKSKAVLGPNHPYTLDSMSKLAEAYEKTGRLDEALSLYERTLALQRVKPGPDHPDTMKTLSHLAQSYLETDKLERASKLLREGLALQEKKRPAEWRTFHIRSLLGETLLGQKKYAEAEPLLVQGYKGMKERERKIPPDEKGRLTEARQRLVRLYDAIGKNDEAAQWRQRAKR